MQIQSFIRSIGGFNGISNTLWKVRKSYQIFELTYLSYVISITILERSYVKSW